MRIECVSPGTGGEESVSLRWATVQAVRPSPLSGRELIVNFDRQAFRRGRTRKTRRTTRTAIRSGGAGSSPARRQNIFSEAPSACARCGLLDVDGQSLLGLTSGSSSAPDRDQRRQLGWCIVTARGGAPTTSTTISSPVIAVDYLVEGSPVRFANRSQRPIGGVPESDHVCARVVWGDADDTSTLFLISDGRMTAPDAQVRGGQHH
jgi:hypothetical protein